MEGEGQGEVEEVNREVECRCGEDACEMVGHQYEDVNCATGMSSVML